MPRPARVSPEKILAAAAAEFSERGYAGARVDRIARRARVNKAMLYYHFASKQGLYRTLLRQTFGAIAAQLQEIAASPDLDSPRKLDAAVAALAAHIEAHRHFPSIMLREVADGGTHLDAETLAALAAVPTAFAAILRPGIADGAFRAMHPIAAYFTTIAPILMFVASSPVRKQIVSRQTVQLPGPALATDSFLDEFTTSLQRAFAAAPVRQRRS
jgi:TetR/AcrR family transcriptional regulator